MTNQEAFDKMMNHLRNLKGRSEGPIVLGITTCVYNGKMCAVGALMTDLEQEKWGAFDDDVEELLEDMYGKDHKSLLHDLDCGLLDCMQQLHDSDQNWNDNGNFEGEDKAQEIATGFSLTYTGV